MQPTASFIVDCVPIQLITTVTTGVYSSATLIDPATLVLDWNSRFGSLFRDYRVVKATARFILFSSSNTGQINAYFNEESATAPTATVAQHERAKRFPASAVEKTHVLNWVPNGPGDLAFISTGVATASTAYLKVYTDNANYGSPIAVTNLGVIQLSLTIQFREFV